ncbi:hypothetical protein V6N13_064559 [Hibiscus sabdariffa]
MKWDASLGAPSRRNQTSVSQCLLEDTILGIQQVGGFGVSFSGNFMGCGLGPITGLGTLGPVSMNSVEAMYTGDAEDIPIEHTEGSKRQ